MGSASVVKSTKNNVTNLPPETMEIRKGGKVTLFHKCNHVRSFVNDLDDFDEARAIMTKLEASQCDDCLKKDKENAA